MSASPGKDQLLARIRLVTGLFMAGLVVSGVTAIPLVTEVDWLVTRLNAGEAAAGIRPAGWAVWILKVQSALHETAAHHPFLFYGTDWLAFGHFAIALAFVGAVRDPVRNRWLFTFGLMACALLIPYAFVFGAIRGIPFWWQCIDCAFGVLGAIPLWFCHRWVAELDQEFRPGA